MTLPRRPGGRLAALGLATVTVTVAAAMAGAPASAAPPEGQILNAGGATAVANSYIVVLKDSAVSRAAVGATARQLTARHGGAVARTYSAALRGFQVTGTGTGSWVSAIDMASLMALSLLVFAEVIVLIFSLWLLFRTTQAVAAFPQAPEE